MEISATSLVAQQLFRSTDAASNLEDEDETRQVDKQEAEQTDDSRPVSLRAVEEDGDHHLAVLGTNETETSRPGAQVDITI